MQTTDFNNLSIGTLGKFTKDSEVLIRRVKDPNSPLGFSRLSFNQLKQYVDFDPITLETIIGTVEIIDELTKKCESAISYIHQASAQQASIFSSLTANSAVYSVVCSNVHRLFELKEFVEDYSSFLSTNYAIVSTLSTNLNTAQTVISTITSLGNNTALWNSVYTTVSATSAKWNNTFTTVSAHSGAW